MVSILFIPLWGFMCGEGFFSFLLNLLNLPSYDISFTRQNLFSNWIHFFPLSFQVLMGI